MTSRLSTLFSLLVCASSALGQEGALHLFSEPGHRLGNGESLTFTFDRADVEAVVIDNTARVRPISPGPPNWGVNFGAAASEPLRTGCYERATQGPERAFPAFSFSRDSVVCFSTVARFRLIELEFDDGSGQIGSLALDFVDQCDLRGPALYGQLRVNSSVPVGDPLDPVFSTIGLLQTFGEPGDPVLAGQFIRTFTEQRFTAWPRDSGGSGVWSSRLELEESSLLDVTFPQPRWQMGFRTAGGDAIEAGSYPDAVDFTWGDPALPGLCFGRDSIACSADSGHFNVQYLEREPVQGRPVRGRVNFERTISSSGTRVHGLVDFHTLMRNGPKVDDVLALGGFEIQDHWPLYWECE